MTTVALVVVDLERTRLGLGAMAARVLAGRSVLEWTVGRVARVARVERVVVVHPAGQDVEGLLRGKSFGKAVSFFGDEEGLRDGYWGMRAAARKWAVTAWRGGLGGACVYDELLPARPLFGAMEKFEAGAALLVGGEWGLVDVGLCGEVLGLQLEHGEAMPMTFCQAPPGLCGIAVNREIVGQLAEHAGSTFGGLLAYDPVRAQADPIGKDVCVQVAGNVRSCGERVICDTSRGWGLFEELAARFGGRFGEVGAQEIVEEVVQSPVSSVEDRPQQVTVELTARREVEGLVVPQGRLRILRPAMDPEVAVRVVEQLGVGGWGRGEVALTLGGLGDALLYPEWERVVEAAAGAGVLGIAMDTDLLVGEGVLGRLLELPVDVVTVRLNADTAAVYERVTAGGGDSGGGKFKRVISNLEWMFNEKNRRRSGEVNRRVGLPWIVPRMVKTRETLGDMETFFDRWVHYAGHAVIEPATAGRGSGGVALMEAMSPVAMTPGPGRRKGCRQLERRMTVLSDGRVALCDQDWLGDGSVGDAGKMELGEIWRKMGEMRQMHRDGRWGEMELCGGCGEWHRP